VLPFISIGQFDFEIVLGTNLNMSLKDEYTTDVDGPLLNTDTHFAGGGLDLGFGLRFRFSESFAISGAFEYQYKGHESNFTSEPKYDENAKHSFHSFVFPFDICYTFKNKIGIHLGVELATLLFPKQQNRFVAYQDKVLVAAIVGLSYTKDKFRFELFYKHYFMHYLRMTMYFNVGQNLPLVEVAHYTRFHDVQFRIAYRLFSVN